MSFHPNDVARRARMASLFLGVGFVVLVGAFFKTQVIQNKQYVMQSEENRLRPIPLPHPRHPRRWTRPVATPPFRRIRRRPACHIQKPRRILSRQCYHLGQSRARIPAMQLLLQAKSLRFDPSVRQPR